jgi:hypothetical protein
MLLLLLSACQGEQPPSPTETNTGPPPAAVCAEVRKGLAGLQAQPSFDQDNKGEATIEQAAWMAMSPDDHAQLAKTLAFAASCTAGHQSDAQQVRIRNETGTILLESTISTKVDLRSVMKKQG